MRCHRPWLAAGEDPRIARAVRAAERDAVLKEAYARQAALDDAMMREIAAVPLPEDLAARLDAMPERSEHHGMDFRAMMRQPVAIAIAIALVVFLGWGIFAALTRMDSFPGKEDVERMIEGNDTASATDFRLKTAEVGNLADWMFSNFGFENFYVPPELAACKTAGCRVFRQDTLPVAEYAIADHDMIFYMFKADDFGVKVKPAGQWRLFTDEGWVAAVQQHEESCFMVAFRGTKRDMERFLAGAH